MDRKHCGRDISGGSSPLFLWNLREFIVHFKENAGCEKNDLHRTPALSSIRVCAFRHTS